ncbi:tRNA (adenosine(37)-N6)-threonylcarbamoyltransferase complex ATPase subunit type 1 TsaE [Tundrisphaera lichenicola]|uniref:tRNA (adenosine(37)-N6)-threonylcarbamoyltransferase complex ATPase subunit type 1 TsaE n=1 Tax=Tundrisphaera lichenicola TaxID=2029860 RepID=UPI003EB708AF
MNVVRVAKTTLRIELESERETEKLGQAMARVARPGLVIGLVGSLGAGKTRLVRSIAESLGVDHRAIASPTYVLIHEYEGSLPIYHFDAYRLEGPDEFDALGASDYWSEGRGLCLIEWADLVADRLPKDTWWVRIAPSSTEARSIQLDTTGAPQAANAIEAGLTSDNLP